MVTAVEKLKIHGLGTSVFSEKLKIYGWGTSVFSENTITSFSYFPVKIYVVGTL